MGRTLLASIFMLAVSSSAIGRDAQPQTAAFRWLSPGKDATLFERVKTAFAEELKPDDPEKVAPVVAQEYKWISRVGAFGASALVLIGERESRTSTYGNYFVAFTYDFKSGEKTSLTSSNNTGFMQWKFKDLVRFDSSKIPDVVFTYVSCTECEADYLLSSFRFDSTEAKWKVRTWIDEKAEVLIGSDYTAGTEEDSKDDCLFKFADFNGDGFADLAVRCLTVTVKGRVLEDSTTIFTIQHGLPQVLSVTDQQQLAAIRARLCVDVKKSRLCPSK